MSNEVQDALLAGLSPDDPIVELVKVTQQRVVAEQATQRMLTGILDGIKLISTDSESVKRDIAQLNTKFEALVDFIRHDRADTERDLQDARWAAQEVARTAAGRGDRFNMSGGQSTSVGGNVEGDINTGRKEVKNG